MTILLSSPRIRHLLAIALFAGNHLNGGTPRGRADGFAIECLSQMKLVKMSQGDQPGTLVDFIMQQMEKKYPGELAEVFDEVGEGEQIRRAARRKLNEAEQELTKMTHGAKQMLRQLQVHGAEDEILARHREILAMANAELEALQVRYKQLTERYAELCVWFHQHQEGNGKQKPSDEFFGIWCSFLNDVNGSWKAAEKEALKQRNKRPANQQQRRRHERAQTLHELSNCIDEEVKKAEDELGAHEGLARGPITPRGSRNHARRRCKTFAASAVDMPDAKESKACDEVKEEASEVDDELVTHRPSDSCPHDASFTPRTSATRTRSPSQEVEPAEAEPPGDSGSADACETSSMY